MKEERLVTLVESEHLQAVLMPKTGNARHAVLVITKDQEARTTATTFVQQARSPGPAPLHARIATTDNTKTK
jgi:hypothetical protein